MSQVPLSAPEEGALTPASLTALGDERATENAAESLPLLLPVKDLRRAKARLAGVLSPDERAGVVLAMLADVIAAGRSAGFAVHVVSPDPKVLAAAEAAAARPLLEPDHGLSLNGALEWALRAHVDAPAAAVVLPDVPLVTPDELLALAGSHPQPGPSAAPPFPLRGRGESRAFTPSPSMGEGGGGGESRAQIPTVRVAPDRGRRGTNGLVIRPVGAIPMCFGPRSLAAHRQAAKARGVSFQIIALPGLALDLDTPADLGTLLEAPGTTRTHQLLFELGLKHRLPMVESAHHRAPRRREA